MDSTTLSVPVELVKGKIEYYEVPLFQMKPEDFLRRLVVLFGESGSGKTQYVKDILYRLKDIVPNVILFSGSESQNKDFEGIIQRAWIHDTCESEILKKIFDRQKMATEVYKQANNIDTITELYNTVAEDEEKMLIKRAKELHEAQINQINSSREVFDVKKSKIDQTNGFYKLYCCRVMKACIQKHQLRLKSVRYPTGSSQSICLKYLNFNPNLILIFDDMASQIKKLSKDPTIESLFFQGRHSYITSIYLFQDDKTIPPPLRKNAFIKIFCTYECASTYFDTVSNGLPRNTQKIAQAVSSHLFRANKDGTRNYKKLIYIRDAAEKLQYSVCELRDKFQMGSHYLKDYSEKIENDDKIDTSNEFLSNFIS